MPICPPGPTAGPQRSNKLLYPQQTATHHQFGVKSESPKRRLSKGGLRHGPVVIVVDHSCHRLYQAFSEPLPGEDGWRYVSEHLS